MPLVMSDDELKRTLACLFEKQGKTSKVFERLEQNHL